MARLFQLIIGENCTIPNGTAIQVVQDAFSDNKTQASTEDDYDAVGAMQFIVATILLYSILGFFCTLLIKIKRYRGRSHLNSLMDESVDKYLKEENALKFTGHTFSLRHACRQVSLQLQEYEEKQSWLSMEREKRPETTHTNSPEASHKKLLKTKRNMNRCRREELILNDRIYNIDVQVLTPGSDRQVELVSDRAERPSDTDTSEDYSDRVDIISDTEMPEDPSYRVYRTSDTDDQSCESLDSIRHTDNGSCNPLRSTVTNV